MDFSDHAVKPFTQEQLSQLSVPGDFSVSTSGEFRAHQDCGLASGVERLIEKRAKKEGRLGESDPLDGEDSEVVLKMGVIAEIFEADDGERAWSEAAFARVLGGAVLAPRGCAGR